MKILLSSVMAALLSAATCSLAQDKSWVEVGGAVYGAKPDARGPIGGGKGYKGAVAKADFVVSSLDSLISALAKVRSGQVILIPGDTEIDLTTLIYIDELVLVIPEGVTLAGERGHNGSQGAILTSDALKTPVMIRVAGPNVRITGLRLQGPCPKRYMDHHSRAFGPGGEGSKYYYKFPTSNCIETKFPNLEVDNCEISAFSHGGVYLISGVGHRIHHNFIHHCQYNGLGYGVCHGVASSLIEYNLFDSNRHSIAGTGSPGCGYIARNNIELGESLSHCFDMHGGRDRKDGTDIAGTSIEISNNTFRAVNSAVVIRGVPEVKCEVSRNWFPKHTDASMAVRAAARTTVENNVYGEKPTAKK